MPVFDPTRRPGWLGYDHAAVCSTVDYDPRTGLFTWKERGPELYGTSRRTNPVAQTAAWNLQYAGKPAFTTLNDAGYFSGRLFNRTVVAHRLAWFVTHGEWPSMIDHINRVRTDNRIDNLRIANYFSNARNRGFDLSSKLNPVGIKQTKCGSWHAYIAIAGKFIQLGAFDTEDEALAARNAAVRVIKSMADRQLMAAKGQARAAALSDNLHSQPNTAKGQHDHVA